MEGDHNVKDKLRADYKGEYDPVAARGAVLKKVKGFEVEDEQRKDECRRHALYYRFAILPLIGIYARAIAEQKDRTHARDCVKAAKDEDWHGRERRERWVVIEGEVGKDVVCNMHKEGKNGE